MENENIISCPKCGAIINVRDILYHQIQEQLKKDFETQNTKNEEDYKKKLKDLQTEKAQLDNDKENVQQQVDSAVKTKLSSEKTKLEKTLRQQIDEERSGEVKTLEEELKQKSEQVKELNKTKADNARLQREKDELRGTIEVEESEKFNKQLIHEKEKIQSAVIEQSKTELQKRDKLISDLITEIGSLKNKSEQGSNKLLGEVKEIELRKFLEDTFPIDEVTDVPSGVKGADVFHIIKNAGGQDSGVIIYERKETKNYSNDWIPKLKIDGIRVKADICVIVTRTMPPDNSETHFRDGVWVCTFDDIKIITMLLRDGLIKQYSALASQTDKGTKMEILYDYLRGNDFQNHILGIIDAFRKMDKLLIKEKEEALKKFAEREAHIFQAKQSVLHFWGRVDGIATDSLSKEIKMLESVQHDNNNTLNEN